MKDKFLPIGSVVLLKGGKKELMITGYCIIANGQDPIDEVNHRVNMHEYSACTYPEGVINSDVAYVLIMTKLTKFVS